MTLLPGANAALPDGPLAVTITHDVIAGAEIDVSAFLLTSAGKVRGDADMCFYGQPVAENGAVRHVSGTSTLTRFEINPAKIGGDVEKIVIVATIHENRASFGALAGITIQAAGDAGTLQGQIPCSGMSETALILAEIYRRQNSWKMRVVGQGFNGGLAVMAPHFGVVVGDGPTPAAPPPSAPPLAAPLVAPRVPTKPVSLQKVSLTKKGDKARISLKKGGSAAIRVTATWIDNGDSRSDNDDLDLRAGILMPDGKMHWLAASHPGALDKVPWARHLGDVRGATKDAPGTEIIEVNPDISRCAGGRVGLVFSVYSAVSNGAVSIASLHPVIVVEHDGNTVECRYSFPDGGAAQGVFTYVIGTIELSSDGIDVQLSGMTSPKGSENTPWIVRAEGGLAVTFDGTPVFKKGRTLMARMLGAGKNKYTNV